MRAAAGRAAGFGSAFVIAGCEAILGTGPRHGAWDIYVFGGDCCVAALLTMPDGRTYAAMRAASGLRAPGLAGYGYVTHLYLSASIFRVIYTFL